MTKTCCPREIQLLSSDILIRKVSEQRAGIVLVGIN